MKSSTPFVALLGCCVLLTTGAAPFADSPRFFDDDPLTREPESQDAGGAQAWKIDLLVDLATNLFGRPGDPATNVRARNVNSIDEVPDSNWFTNRVLAREVTPSELSRGPLTGSGPAPGTWSVVAPKEAGFSPGFTMRDTRDDLWFISFEAAGHPEAATGAILVANKLFWALGYWQVENYLVTVRRDQIAIAETATFTPQSGRERPMRLRDLDEVFARSHRGADGSYRAVAARAVPGRPIGGFRYYGTRPDDPNDVIPHEHRRELRALKVFGAWTNLVDMKAGNTLDTVIVENGRNVVRHYLQDVGSTFGTGANGPHEYDEGWELLIDPTLARKRLLRLGFVFEPWQTVRYVEQPAIGPFEGDAFAPREWRPRVATAAFLRAREDDTFWAARRVAAFSEPMIRSAVQSGGYSDPAAEALLVDVLIKRQRKIAETYLTAINPLVDFTLGSDGRLGFRNAAEDAGVATAPPDGYEARWMTFDNATGATQPLGAATRSSSREITAPATLPASAGTLIAVEVVASGTARPEWKRPVTVYFRRTTSEWRLIGLERAQ